MYFLRDPLPFAVFVMWRRRRSGNANQINLIHWYRVLFFKFDPNMCVKYGKSSRRLCYNLKAELLFAKTHRVVVSDLKRRSAQAFTVFANEERDRLLKTRPDLPMGLVTRMVSSERNTSLHLLSFMYSVCFAFPLGIESFADGWKVEEFW